MDRSDEFQATHGDDAVPSEKDRIARVDTLGAAEVVERILAAQAGSSAALGELFQNCRKTKVSGTNGVVQANFAFLRP